MSTSALHPTVTVVVPTFRDWGRVSGCLRGLSAQSYPAERMEFVIVNNDPDDPAPPELLVDDRIRVVEEPRRGSYAARNAGIACSRSDIVAFTDSDCVPDAGWIEHGVAAILSGVDRAAGAIEVTVSRERASHAELHELASAFDQARYVRRGFGATANLIVRREALDRVGPFDADLISGGDIEWNRRATAAGFSIAYAAEARVAHPARTMTEELLVKDARVWRGKVTIDEFPRPVLAAIAILQAIVPPFTPALRAHRRSRGIPRPSLPAHLIWLWRYRIRRGVQRVRLSFEPPERTVRPSVAIAVGSLVGGGAERSTLLIARHWPADDALQPRLMVRELAGAFIPEIPECVPVDVVGQTRALRVPGFLATVRRTVRRHRIRAIISNSPRLSNVLLLGRRLGIIPCPVVVVERGNLTARRQREGLHRAIIDRWLRSRAAVTVAVARALEEEIARDFGERAKALTTIENAGSFNRVREPRDSAKRPRFDERLAAVGRRPRFVSVGRLEYPKRPDLAVRAFSAVPPRNRGSMEILGSGSGMEPLKKLALDLGVASEVRFSGFILDVHEVLRRSDVLVLTSDFEGFPRVLIEGLLCGLRIVATDCPTGPREILQGVAGTQLVPVGDVDALREAMEQLGRDALTGRPARGEDEQRAIVERFDPSRMAARYARLVDSIVT